MGRTTAGEKAKATPTTRSGSGAAQGEGNAATDRDAPGAEAPAAAGPDGEAAGDGRVLVPLFTRVGGRGRRLARRQLPVQAHALLPSHPVQTHPGKGYPYPIRLLQTLAAVQRPDPRGGGVGAAGEGL